MSVAGLALGALGIALLVGTFIWRKRAVAARRAVAVIFLVVALVLEIAALPHQTPNRPAPVAGDALVYSVISPMSNSFAPLPASIIALDARTGATQWKKPLPETNVKIVEVSAQSVVAVAGASQFGAPGGRVVALGATTGTLLWQYQLANHEALDDVSAAVPDVVVGANNIFLHTVDVASPTRQERVTALRATDGAVLWRQELQDQALAAAPAVTPSAVFLISTTTSQLQGWSTTIKAVNPATGATLWMTALPALRGSNGLLTASGDAVYISIYEDDNSTQDVAALSATDGAVRWRVPVSHGNLLQLIAGSDAVFAIIYGKVVALDVESGAARWQLGTDNLQDGTALVPHAVTLEDGVLYLAAQHTGPVGDGQGRWTNPETVYAVEASTGAIRWKYATGSYNSGQMTVDGPSVYMRADDGLTTLSAATGARLWRAKDYGLPSDGTTTSQDTPGVIFVGSSETSVQSPCFLICRQLAQPYLSAVNEQDGTPYWRVPMGPVKPVSAHWVV